MAVLHNAIAVPNNAISVPHTACALAISVRNWESTKMAVASIRYRSTAHRQLSTGRVIRIHFLSTGHGVGGA
eukprot:244855-Rhodomonas_salina.2